MCMCGGGQERGFLSARARSSELVGGGEGLGGGIYAAEVAQAVQSMAAHAALHMGPTPTHSRWGQLLWGLFLGLLLLLCSVLLCSPRL